MIADRRCPECHNYPELVAAWLDRIVWCCASCGHRWNEPRERTVRSVRFVGRGGWVRFV
jgi:ribosomal protein L37AE/L43A